MIHVRKSQCLGRTDGRAGGRADGRTDGRADDRVIGHKRRRTNCPWTDGRKDGQTRGRTNVRTDGRGDGRADGRTDGRIDSLVSPKLYIFCNFEIEFKDFQAIMRVV